VSSLRNFFFLIFWTAFVALIHYELVAKSSGAVLGPLPGWNVTTHVERSIPYAAPTGIAPVDRLLHECREATVFYRIMLAGRAD
jgi:hypothetical protein